MDEADIEYCNAMADNLLQQIRGPSALKAQSEFTIDMQNVFAATLDFQLQSSIYELNSIQNARENVNLNSDSRSAVQSIKNKGIFGIWTIRAKRVVELGYTYNDEMFE